MAIIDPLPAILITFCFLGALIYKRLNLGITLNAAALLLALLALDLSTTCAVFLATITNPFTISLVAATFGIMLISLLYKETRLITRMTESLSRMINNPKLIVSLLPAIIGFLPVGGGALMSAPLVETELNKLGLNEEKKTYVNLWFRHTIFPIYPVSQILILTATLTGLTVTALILRQVPVVIVMIIVGYLVGLRKTPKKPPKNESSMQEGKTTDARSFLIAFSPILTTIIAVVIFSIDVAIGAFIGVAALLTITRPSGRTLARCVRNWSIWGITSAAFGAFLLRNVTEAAGIQHVLAPIVSSGSVSIVLLLIAVPAFLSAITGSPSGGITMSISILAGSVAFTASEASLLHMSNYLGYVVAPSHLCLVLTAEYFKCPLGRLYKYLIPSMAISLSAAVLVFFLV